MATRLQIVLLIIMAAALLSAVIIVIAVILSIPSDANLESIEFPKGTIKIGDMVLEVQIADTSPRQIKGLMFQEQLPYDQGMLFIHKTSNVYPLWMMNMQFPLDMIWLDSTGKVVHIEQNVPPCQTTLETASCPSINPGGQALYILEVTAGFVEKFGITEDSVMEIISI